MMTVHHLDRAQARRVAVRAQLLHADRPADLVAMVEQLTLLQIDPTAAVAPSADLVAVNAVHEDVAFDAPTTDAVHAEIEQLAGWLELELVGP